MKNKGLLHPGVTNVTNEEPLQTHMIRRGATYYMRRLVPEELRPYFLTKTGQHRAEFTISLRTKERFVAKERLEIECTKVTALFKEARRKLEAGIPRRKTGTPDRVGAAYDLWQEEQTALQRAIFQRDLEQEAIREDHDAYVAARFGRPLNELSEEDRIIRERLDPAILDLDGSEAKRLSAKQAEWDEGGKEANAAFEQFLISGAFRPQYPLLMEIFDRYVAASSPAPATVKAWRPVIKHLISFLGHDDASKITFENCQSWRDRLLQEPIKKGAPRTTRTIRETYVSAIKATLNYAVEERIIERNPILGLNVRESKRPVLRSRDFNDQEAKTILMAALSISLDQITGNAPRETLLARRWVPWLCAYTGARVNELTQLREMDIKCRDGIWLIHITPEAGRIKNNKAREVPLHPHLLEQGFHELAGKGSKRPIFYDPSRAKGGSAANPQSNKVGERLAVWVRKLGVTDKGVAPNHGWRHVFKTRGRTAGLDAGALDVIQGHAPANEGQNYGGWSAQALDREMRKLPYFKLEGALTG
nr:DUF6538 domain-containing protein [Asticcacaulis taihuensis]